MKKLLSETIIYGIGAILPRIITFILNPFYIYFIDKEEFAQFTNLYAYIALVNIFLTFGFETSFFRFSSDKDSEDKVFSTSFWFLFGMASVFLLGVLIFNQSLADIMGYPDHPEYIRWFALMGFFDTLCVIPFAWLRYHNKPIKYSAIRIAQILIQTLFVIALFIYIPKEFSMVLGMNEQVSYPFYSNVIGSLTGVLLLLPVILKVKWSFYKNLFMKMLKYSYPVMFAGFAFQINENFDKIIQYYKIPQGDAGAYGGCYKLAVLMTLFVTAYRMGVEPYLFKQMNHNNAKITYAKVTEYFTMFAAIAAMGIIANIDWLKRLFISDKAYWTAIDIVPIIIIANLCFGVYYNLSTWYKVTDRTGIGTLISWTGAVITLLMNWFLLDKFGFMISAWATLAAYFCMMVLSYFLGQRYYPIPYRSGKICLILLLLSVFSYFSYKTFNANIWIGNFLLVVFTGIIILSERKFFQNKLENLKIKP